MSARSIDKLEELDSLTKYITNLSTLINKVGSQRILLMKMVLDNTMNNPEVLEQSVASFELNLNEIELSELNTPNTKEMVQDIRVTWLHDKHRIIESDTETNFAKANRIVSKINELLYKYEELAR